MVYETSDLTACPLCNVILSSPSLEQFSKSENLKCEKSAKRTNMSFYEALKTFQRKLPGFV